MIDILYQKKYKNDFDVSFFVSPNWKRVFCPICHKAEDPESAILEEVECDNFNVLKVECPHCHELYSVKTRKSWRPTASEEEMKANVEQFNDVQLYEVKHVRNPSKIKTSECVIHDKENGKITIFISFVNVILAKHHLVVEPYYDKYIFNYKTHMSYMVRNKTFTGKRAFGASGNALVNQTYSHTELSFGGNKAYIMSTEMLEACARAYFKYANLPLVDELIEFANTKSAYPKPALYSIINTANRFPNMLMRYDEYKNSASINMVNNTVYITASFLKEFPRELIDSQKWIRAVIKRHKLPRSKRFRKLYLTHPKFIDRAIYFQQCGFANHDVIYSLVTGDSFLDGGVDITNDYFRLSYFKSACLNARQVIKQMNKYSPEKAVAKRILAIKDIWILDDTCHMYNKIKNHDESLLNGVNWFGSVKKIHDDLSAISTKIKHVNKEIPYKDKERDLERTIGDYQFKLAVDTNELVAIGQEMKICVGSYRDRVLEKRSTIISVRDAIQYVGCIEVDREMHIQQIKGKYNAFLFGEVGKAVKEWVALTGVKGATKCKDYVNIGEVVKKDYVDDDFPF